MKIQHYVQSVFCASLLMFSSQVFAIHSSLHFKPYLGVGVLHTHVAGGVGAETQKIPSREPFFPRNYLGGSVFLGAKLHQYFGFEVGYEQTKLKTKRSNVGNRVFLGDAEDPTTYLNYEIRLRSFYFDLQGYMPLSNSFNILGSIGLSRKMPEVNFYFKQKEFPPVITYTHLPTHVQNKTVLRLGLGAQYMTHSNIGIRAKLYYEKNSKVTATSIDEDGHDPGGHYKLFKNSISISLAFFLRFF